jgi:DNA-binding MarR family transcriptional regulator
MTDPVAVDLWETRALPILRYIAEHEGEQRFINIGELAEATGIEPNLVTVEVERLLDAGYIPGELVKMGTGGDPRPWFLDKSRLTERGARAVSLWPKAEQLLQVLEARAKDEPDPSRKRALMTLVGALKELGIPVISEILSAAAKRTLGMP